MVRLEIPSPVFKRGQLDLKEWWAATKNNIVSFISHIDEHIDTAQYLSVGESRGCDYNCGDYCYEDHLANQGVSIEMSYARPPTDEEIQHRTEIYQKSLELKKIQRKKVAEEKKAALAKTVKANKTQILKILEEMED